jgi:hypothetical protein
VGNYLVFGKKFLPIAEVLHTCYLAALDNMYYALTTTLASLR